MFVVCGLNHKTAPIGVREQFSLSPAATDAWLQGVATRPSFPHLVYLTTCNRTEIYCSTNHPEQLIPWLANEFNTVANELTPYIYQLQDDEAVAHILRVATGLDSMMLGEPQILGQLKQAYQRAENAGTVDSMLRQRFQFAFGASKRVRTKSQIGKNPISIAYAAAQLITQHVRLNKEPTVFIIGSGETASLVAKYLQQYGVTRFIIASRTHDHATELANCFQGRAYSITDIPHCLPQADVVISATACPLPFINKHLMERALADREHKPMFLLDLAIPRDIEANVAELDAVTLYNIDDLQHLIDEGMEERRHAATLAEQLIQEEMKRYTSHQRSLKANTIISDYRVRMKQFADQELQRATQQLTSGKCQHDVLNEFSDRLMNKLIHFPTVGLRQAASDDRQELIELAHYLFTQNPDYSTS